MTFPPMKPLPIIITAVITVAGCLCFKTKADEPRQSLSPPSRLIPGRNAGKPSETPGSGSTHGHGRKKRNASTNKRIAQHPTETAQWSNHYTNQPKSNHIPLRSTTRLPNPPAHISPWRRMGIRKHKQLFRLLCGLSLERNHRYGSRLQTCTRTQIPHSPQRLHLSGKNRPRQSWQMAM